MKVALETVGDFFAEAREVHLIVPAVEARRNDLTEITTSPHAGHGVNSRDCLAEDARLRLGDVNPLNPHGGQDGKHAISPEGT